MHGAGQQDITPFATAIGLHNLIPELLLHIATFLAQTDLLALTLTNKYLKEATEPELFREYVNYKVFLRSIKPFIFRILDQPHLANHVRRVHLGSYRDLMNVDPDIRYLNGFEDCGKEDYQRLAQAAVEHGIIDNVLPYEPESYIRKRFMTPEFQEEYDETSPMLCHIHLYDENISMEDVPLSVQFCKLLHFGIDEPLVVLLLALLPNVREVDIFGAPCHRYSLPWRAKHEFQALRCLRASANHESAEWYIPIFHDVLQSESLRDVQLHGVGTERVDIEGNLRFEARAIPLSPRSTNITHLVLENCDLEQDDTKIMVEACAPLKSFYYSTSVEWNSCVDFTVQDIVKMLDRHKSSLESLSLYMDVEWYEGETKEIISSPSFCDFAVLKKLDTNSIIWANLLQNSQKGTVDSRSGSTDDLIDHLPPSLEQLIIQETRSHTLNEHGNYKQLDSLILQRNEKLPNFQDLVIVHLDDRMTQPRYEELSSMVVRAVQRGFCFSLASRSKYRKAHPTAFPDLIDDHSTYSMFYTPEGHDGTHRGLG